ncbi:MAG: glucose-1-phosphate thymidylyltransferase RfbA [candidate division Zixibacteria bacterium]|nr:glucose-1-phosphate thymidylyltransferase RfbA [candidate division Zixibacteria bacterium]MDD5425120.1 glucose-1-phosphate thymidylyltransferase RfbA [candidate division Zixibacteria bacterium]
MSNAVNKGIILAGGCGSRLYPLSQVVSKQLLPIYDKPMVYYPLATLMLYGVRQILIISTPEDTPRFEALLGNGHHLGLEITYAVQPRPEGIAQALIIGEKFINREPVVLILGDNIFYGDYDFLREARSFETGALIFGYYVNNPQRYGVITFDKKGRPLAIEEKPAVPVSNYAVTGLYIYDAGAVDIAKRLRPSKRGELEITDVNNAYLEKGKLKVVKLGRGIAWLDTGTFENLLDAGNFIATIENRQGRKIACIEEIAYRMKFISKTQMQHLVDKMADNSYRAYLRGVLNEVDGA